MHINPKYHFTRQLIKHGRIKVEYCPTKKMTADILTKPIGSAQFSILVKKILNQ